MKKIVIYSSLICPYCIAAKNFFKNNKLQYTEIIIDNQPEKKKKMISQSGGKFTVPQIFFGNYHVGGYDDLIRLSEQGKLFGILKNE